MRMLPDLPGTRRDFPVTLPASHDRRRSARLTAAACALLVCATFAPAPTFAQDAPILRHSLPADFRPDVESLFAAARRHDLDTVSMVLDRLADHREARNIRNLSAVAVGVLPFLQAATSDQAKAPRTASLFRKVVSLAPDHPAVHFALARAWLARGFDGIGPATDALVGGMNAWIAHPPSVLRFAANAAFHLFGALVLAAFLAIALMLLRHRREVIHDVGDLFPSSAQEGFSASELARTRKTSSAVGRGLMRILTLAATGLLLVLPFLAGVGVLGTLLIWSLVILRYARRTEIAMTFLVIVTIGALPLIGTIALAPRQFDAAPGPAIFECLSEYGSDRSLATLHRLVEERPKNAPVVRHALALHEIQAAPATLPAIALALDRLAPAGDDWTGQIQTFQGNLLLARALSSCTRGRPDAQALAQARGAFDAALKRWPSSPYALRGLSLVQGLSGDRSGREQSLTRLVNVSDDDELEFVARLRTLSGSADPCGNTATILGELRLPDPRSWGVFLTGLDLWTPPEALPFGGLLPGRIPVGWIPWLTLAILGAGILVVVTRRSLHPAETCPRCHTVSCGHCNVRASGFDYCPTCLFEQVKPAFVDPLDLVARQRRRDADGQHSRLLRPILALAVPGSGQILAGRPFRGATMLLMLGIVFSLLVNPDPVHVDIQAFAGATDAQLPVLPPLLLLVVYAWSAIDVWVTRNR
jgi:hypothetical protein